MNEQHLCSELEAIALIIGEKVRSFRKCCSSEMLTYITFITIHIPSEILMSISWYSNNSSDNGQRITTIIAGASIASMLIHARVLVTIIAVVAEPNSLKSHLFVVIVTLNMLFMLHAIHMCSHYFCQFRFVLCCRRYQLLHYYCCYRWLLTPIYCIAGIL
jgi:hypothetical protein